MRRFYWCLIGIFFFSGCSFLDRQKEPELLEVRTDRGSDPSVGRGQEVRVTIFTDDPDNDELDFRWIASGGTFTATRRDTIIDLFQDSVTVVWKAPLDPGVYELFLELSDGKAGTLITSGVRIAVTQVPPVVSLGPDLVLDYGDSLRVKLDGSGSLDPDGDPLTYEWKQVGGPTIALLDGNGAIPSFQALAPADYFFTLRVKDFVDGVGDSSDVATLRVRISDRNGRQPDG